MNDPHEPDAPGEGSSDRDRLLDHEYDGIREYDNKLPNWWQYTLYGAIVFSVVYWLIFHVYDLVPLPLGRYQLEMAEAADAQLRRMAGEELTDQALFLMTSVPDRTARGRKLFEQYCVVCHGQQGEGNVGPNLTDDYWLHGNRPLQILHTVEHGVPAKGMAAWGGQLGPVRVQEVVSYVLTIGGTRLPGKAPQGEELGPPRAPDPVETPLSPDGSGSAPGDGAGGESTPVEAKPAEVTPVHGIDPPSDLGSAPDPRSEPGDGHSEADTGLNAELEPGRP
jgi:cytochrome c oxidase cbb3-type subunit 3